MKTLLVLLVLLASSPKEKTVGHNIAFRVTPDHRLVPVLPVIFEVEQESGGLADGVLVCDAVARQLPDVGTVSVLRCKDKVFVINKILFTESGR